MNNNINQNLEGKILVDSWGYSMTIVDYYKVVKDTGKTLQVQEIGTKILDGGGMCGTCVLDENIVRDEKLYRVYKRIDSNGNGYLVSSLDKSSRHYLDIWDGQPNNYNKLD
jgi:hypothetical protein